MGDLKPVQSMMRTIGAILLVLAGGLLLPACGGSSPAGPSPAPLNLSGTWTGTWTFVTAGVTVTDAVSMTLTHTGVSAGGQWSAAGGAGGQVILTPGASLSGTSSISQTLLTGQNCSASTTLSGTASATQIQFTLGTLTPAGLCQWATNHRFAFTR